MAKHFGDLLTVEHFLRLPECKPYPEFFGGRVVQKRWCGVVRSRVRCELATQLHNFAKARKLGQAFLSLRCTFSRVSLVPDVSYYSRGRLPKLASGEECPDVLVPPDITVEILSPGQSVAELRVKLRQALNHGSGLGWLIHPKRRAVQVLRTDHKAEELHAGDVLSGEDVLPGFALPVAEIFGWLDED
jgi:Uma2 family endonuclease